MKTLASWIIAGIVFAVFFILACFFAPRCIERANLLFSVSATVFAIQVAAALFLRNLGMPKVLSELGRTVAATSLSKDEKENVFDMAKSVLKYWSLLSHIILIALVFLIAAVFSSAWISFLSYARILAALAVASMAVGMAYLMVFVCILIWEIRRVINTEFSLMDRESKAHKENGDSRGN